MAVPDIKKRTPMKSRGFTLIEMLAVIAIVAILAGLLASAAMSSRRAALETGDISNLRQIGQAQAIYTTDHDGIEKRDVLPLVESGVVDSKCLQSALDPSQVGYANQFRISRGADPLRFKSSYLTLKDAERSEDVTAVPDQATRSGWLISATHGLNLSPEMLVPSFFEGRYHRLCNDGSVVTRSFYWHMIDAGGTKQWAVNVSRSFYDLPESANP